MSHFALDPEMTDEDWNAARRLARMSGNTTVSGPVGDAAIKLLAYDQRTMNAVREIRELIRPWGDGDHARLIRSILDRWNV